VDAAVDILSAAVHCATDQSRGFIRKPKYPSWFSATQKYYIRKKNYYHERFKKKNMEHFYNQFSKYRKLVKTTIKSDRLVWLKLIDDDLKRQPTKFSKYVSIFRKSNSTFIQLHVDGTCIDDPDDVAEDFAKHFYTSYSRISPPLSSILAYCSDFLPLAPIRVLDIQKAVKRLVTTKSLGPPKGCKVNACLNACHTSNTYLPLRCCLPPNGSLPASDCLPARSCLPVPACLPASGSLTERQRRPASGCLPPRDRLPTII
jgi:capsular polysaccharide biosynthesis protein